MRILWKHLPAGLQIRYRDTALKSSLIFHSASIRSTWALFSFVLRYIFLDVHRISKLERSWNAKTASRTDRKLCVSIQRSWDLLAEMANVCLSFGGGHVFCASLRGAIDESPLLLTEKNNIYILFISIKTSSVAGLPMPLWAVHLYAPSSCLETMVSGNATMVLS